jgi:hypothetical protein
VQKVTKNKSTSRRQAPELKELAQLVWKSKDGWLVCTKDSARRQHLNLGIKMLEELLRR